MDPGVIFQFFATFQRHFNWLISSKLSHGGLGLTEVWTRGYGPGAIFPIFDFLIAFYMKYIMRQKYSAQGALGGGHQSETVKFSFQRCLQKNLNCGQKTNNKHIIIFEKIISDELRSIRVQNHMVAYRCFPITAPYKNP